MEAMRSVFVGNLAWTTTNDVLTSFLESVGIGVQACQIQYFEESKRSKGWGIVKCITEEDANRAVAVINGTELEGRTLHVRLDRANVESNGASVFVGNLKWDVTDEILKEALKQFQPTEVMVFRNMTGRSRGFALVKFESEEKARLAIAGMDQIEIYGRKIECRLDRGPGKKGKEESENPSTVFIGDLPLYLYEEEVLAALPALEGLVSFHLNRGQPSGESKGWGLLSFVSDEAASAAVRILDGFQLGERHVVARRGGKHI